MACASVDLVHVIVQLHSAEGNSVMVPVWRLQTVPGMVVGLLGLCGLLAVQVVGLDSRSDSGFAATRLLDMEGASVWDKIVKSGIAMSICSVLHTHSGHLGVHGNVALHNVEEGFRLGEERVRMVTTVRVATWNIKFAILTYVQN